MTHRAVSGGRLHLSPYEKSAKSFSSATSKETTISRQWPITAALFCVSDVAGESERANSNCSQHPISVPSDRGRACAPFWSAPLSRPLAFSPHHPCSFLNRLSFLFIALAALDVASLFCVFDSPLHAQLNLPVSVGRMCKADSVAVVLPKNQLMRLLFAQTITIRGILFGDRQLQSPFCGHKTAFLFSRNSRFCQLQVKSEKG